ncbi:MAG TPA: PIN domain-containing protein [Steroidobacteraceae bacterium]|jgi:PIN domain nuclease of toxin-antitoxin system|nr:PIN domain-containing protein [Steroidobacteraceae bacterium]
MSSVETPVAVTDTHALIWAIDGRRKRLGKHARRIFDGADEGTGAIYIPAHALAELGEACHRSRIMLALPFEEWARAAFASGKYHEAELTAEIVYAAQRLYSIPERGDRLIAATAVVLDLPLITRDPEIHKAAGIECIW